MSTPAQLRRQAADLREAARDLRAKAPSLDDDAAGVLSHYPHASDGVWWGSAADEFYTLVGGAKKTLGDLATDLLGYAGRCDQKARELDQEAHLLEQGAS